MPMIRKITPQLIAQDLVSVQPMGLGPPVCEPCMIVGTLTEHKPFPWRCLHCGAVELKSHLWNFIKPTQELIEARTNLVKDRQIMDFGNYIYRKFMFPDDPREPNVRYRPWLEEKIGKQGVDWDWDIYQGRAMDDWNKLRVSFKNHEDAILFELTCH